MWLNLKSVIVTRKLLKKGEEGYDVGELVLTVKGIGNVGRSSIIEATVGADKASDGTKNRD